MRVNASRMINMACNYAIMVLLTSRIDSYFCIEMHDSVDNGYFLREIVSLQQKYASYRDNSAYC